jgi:hypothetical protein
MLGSLNKLLRPFFCPPKLNTKKAALEGGFFFVSRYLEASVSHGTVMTTGLTT